MSLPRKPFSVESNESKNNYEIRIANKDRYTDSVQITDASSQVMIDLPLDPMDNTLAAKISNDAIAKLGQDAEEILKNLSVFLREQMGAKEFIIIPTNAKLPNFTPAQDHGFKRARHASRIALEKSSAAILEQHKDLVMELDSQYEIVSGIKELEKKLDHDNPYNEIYALLNKHANFTPGKMSEYKYEDEKIEA